MPTIDAWLLFEHWRFFPPEHESAAIIAIANGWRPPKRELTESEQAEELDRKYGGYLRPHQMASMGLFGGLAGIKPGDKVPGIGPLPWPEMQKPKDKQ